VGNGVSVAVGVGGGVNIGSNKTGPVSVAYSPHTQQNSGPESGLRIYQYLLVGSRPYTSANSPTNNAPSMPYTLPGPLRQLVGTETLINETSGEGVKTSVAMSVGVGVEVSVGVIVGGSDVNVNVGVGASVDDEVACGTFCVSPAITVCAAAVLIAPASGVEKAGTAAQAKLTIHNTATDK